MNATQFQGKIIAAIAAYLQEATTTRPDKFENFLLEFKAPITGDYNEYLKKIAEEIAAAISPLVEAGDDDWENAPPWANWKTVDIDSTVTFHENKPEHGQHTNRWRSTKGRTLTKGRKCINWKKEIYERHK